MIRFAAPALLLLAAAAPPAPSPAYDRAIAAGYKALTYCNGVFLARRTPAQIDGEELRGIYAEYDPIVPTLPAQVDPDTFSVRVPWSPTLPPRRAEWYGKTGCSLLPIGATETRVAGEWMATDVRRIGPRVERWPVGDAGNVPRPAPRVARLVAATFDGASFGTGVTTGIVVVKDGKVLAERYAAGWGAFVANRTWSVGKSIAGTLIGLANMDPAKPAAIPEWADPADPRRDITLDQLLRMASGLHSDTAGNRTDAIYFGGTTVTEDATAWPLEAKPGTRFRYANDDILLAVRALRATVRDAYDNLPRETFDRLGMTHTWAGTDWRGNYILSSQVWSTARDLARLGQFWLQDGVWQGKRLLPAGWMRYMTTPSGPQPADGPGYGATMWLFGPKQGLPPGSYAAQGNRGQYVMVIPSERLVIVRRGEDPTGARFDIAAFTARVIEATR